MRYDTPKNNTANFGIFGTKESSGGVGEELSTPMGGKPPLSRGGSTISRGADSFSEAY